MNCLACGRENPESAKFCNECAEPLRLRCSKCGVSNPPGSKFCNECASSVTTGVTSSLAKAKEQSLPDIHISPEQSDAPIEGELKTVTALFADIKWPGPVLAAVLLAPAIVCLFADAGLATGLRRQPAVSHQHLNWPQQRHDRVPPCIAFPGITSAPSSEIILSLPLA